MFPQLPQTERIESADRFLTDMNTDLRPGGARAYYRKTEDFIYLPSIDVFKEIAAEHTTLLTKAFMGQAQRTAPLRPFHRKKPGMQRKA